MAAPTTIHDLPDDMLHEIFERVFAGEPGSIFATRPADGTHLALRSVCRRWRDIADWVRVSTSTVGVDTSNLADAGAIRARHPAAFKRLALGGPAVGHSTSVSLAATSLINGSADLRRGLLFLSLHTCCRPALVPAVTPIASCTALTELVLSWSAHENERVVPSTMLAPLSALRMLNTLVYAHVSDGPALPTSAVLAPLPALPDAPRLTQLALHMMGNFVPVGSDAALGRLRRLEFSHPEPVRELLDAEDPFLLRTAFDAGTWQPSLLTGLQELGFSFHPVSDSRAPLLPSPTGSDAGSEWAPLAGQVTRLNVVVTSGGYTRPSTGIVAGLGALTALRDLRVYAQGALQLSDLISLEPVSLDRVRAPQLTKLEFDCICDTVSVAQFPKLVHLYLGSLTHQPPLYLRSLVARSRLKSLILVNRASPLPSMINLAELFVGGARWPVLGDLTLHNAVLEWDATGLADTPTAAEFAGRARQLLPALVKVKITGPAGEYELDDPSLAEFVEACSEHVVPALLGLHAGED